MAALNRAVTNVLAGAQSMVERAAQMERSWTSRSVRWTTQPIYDLTERNLHRATWLGLNFTGRGDPRANTGHFYPPSVVNNYHSPLTTGRDCRWTLPWSLRRLNLTVEVQKYAFIDILRHLGLHRTNSWLFYTGLRGDIVREIQQALLARFGHADTCGHLHYLSTFINEQPDELQPWSDEAEGLFEGFYWAVSSVAFAQVVRGDIYVAIPWGKPINNPYLGTGADAKASFFWGLEVAELTRRTTVNRIILVQIVATPDGHLDPDAPMPMEVIWKQGDEPWSYPASPWEQVVCVTEDFYPRVYDEELIIEPCDEVLSR